MKKGLIKGIMATLGGILLYGMMSVSALAATGDVPINALTFPDGNFRQYILNNVDTTSPKGVLSQTEMQKVTQMDIAMRGIKNVKGLEYFTSLKDLNCRRNDIRDLNVSKNVLLQILDCSGNYYMKELYLTNNTALQELYASDNSISCLDLSKNSSLTTIYLESNDLRILKLAKSTKLLYLDLYRNKLRELDVTGFPNLAKLNVGYNELEYLDVSKNLRLWSLDCQENELFFIDVSHNALLRERNEYSNDAYLFATVNEDGERVIDLSQLPNGFDLSRATFYYCTLDGNQLVDLKYSYVLCHYETKYQDYTSFYWNISMDEAPTIWSQPTSQVVRAGDKAVFEVYSRDKRVAYQWYVSTDGGATWKKSTAFCAQTPTFTITADPKWDGMLLKCVLTADRGKGKKTTSKIVKLYVPGTPAITKQPSSVISVVGSKVNFSVSAEGTGLTYQWAYSTDEGRSWHTSTASSASTPTFSITAATKWNGAMFRCYITDSKGNKNTSKDATLVVKETPVITTQPVSVSASVGAKATYKVAAKGEGLTYNWLYTMDNGKTWQTSTASSAKTATFSITAATKWNGMKLKCQIKDKDGVVITTNTVSLTVK